MRRLFSFLVVFIAHCIQLHGSDFLDYYDHVVPIGPHCQAAQQLIQNKLRTRAYPFDILITTDFEGLLKFIDEEGVHFLAEDSLFFVNQNESSYVKEHHYNFIFFHDFELCADRFMQKYAAIKEKYDRRVLRFFKLLKSNERVLFIRQEMTREQAIELDALLQHKFPHLIYTILALGQSEEFLSDWLLPRIKNLHLPQPDPYVWTGDDEKWAEVLNQVHLSTGRGF